jgi:tRNA A-37 threonylcarbamoyl transferase component Bud32
MTPQPAISPYEKLAVLQVALTTANLEDGVGYLPNASFFLWFKPTVIKLLMVTALTPIIIMVLMALGVIDHWLLPLLKEIVSSMRSLLIKEAPGNVTVLLNFISQLEIGVLAAAGLGIAYATARVIDMPNRLLITKDYLLIGRASDPLDTRFQSDVTTSGAFRMSHFVNFNKVTDLAIVRPANTRSSLDYSIVFTESNNRKFSLRYGDILNADDRRDTLERLANRFPTLLSPQALEPLLPPDENQSYTALWLRELTAPPKRDKLAPLATGTILNKGRYSIIEKIGVGGQGTVYLARDERAYQELPDKANLDAVLKTEVVLKEFLLPVYPDASVRKAAALRFQDEATLLARLDHPKIVKFKELFLEDHRAYLVLEKLSGENLRDQVNARGPISIEEAGDYLGQLTEILVYLHDQAPPVVHRDFTPDNLIKTEDGTLKLIDFSVAQAIDSTITGSVVGKPNFIAPEQFRGKAVPQSDIYSLGATMYFLIEGELPEPISTLALKNTVTPYRQKLSSILENATRLDTDKRYSSIIELRNDLISLTNLKSTSLKE